MSPIPGSGIELGMAPLSPMLNWNTGSAEAEVNFTPLEPLTLLPHPTPVPALTLVGSRRA